MAAGYQLLPWVRRGLSAALPQPDTMQPTLPARAHLSAGVLIANADLGGAPSPDVPLTLYGPGDVAGIDPRLIVRVDPRGSSIGFEPNYCAAIEFDPPDLPWMFSPVAPDAAGRLRPWLVLVVVDLAVVPAPKMEPGRPLPVLRIKADVSGSELPDLAESWAWAHAQVSTGDTTAAVDPGALATQPHLNVSRLLCGRRLLAERRYAACLVPAFAVGVRRGLGLPAQDEGTLAPAWSVEAPADVLLPVYFHWEFATGPEGDFEALARRLVPVKCPPQVGETRMDVSVAGPGLEPPVPAPATSDQFEDNAVRLRGALRRLGPDTTLQALSQVPTHLQDGLRDRLNAPAEVARNGSAGAPVLGPPLYGEWHASRHTVDASGPAWFDELNADPRQRVAAGLGTEVVRENQETFMQSAWEQVGSVIEANRLLSRARLAMEAATGLYRRHLLPLDARKVATFAAPMQARTLDPAGDVTVRAAIGRTSLPDASMDGAMRRMLSPARATIKASLRRAGLEKAARMQARLELAPRLIATLAAAPPDLDPRRFALEGPTGIPGLRDVPTTAGAVSRLDAIGIPVTVPTPTVSTMRAAIQDAGTRDFAREPTQLAPRPGLATEGMLTQGHLAAITEATELAQADGAQGSVSSIVEEIVANLATIGDDPVVLVPRDDVLAVGVLRADAATRDVNITFVRGGQVRKVAELAPDAVAAGTSATALSQALAGLTVLPISRDGRALTPLQGGAGGRLVVGGGIATTLQRKLATRGFALEPPAIAGRATGGTLEAARSTGSLERSAPRGTSIPGTRDPRDSTTRTPVPTPEPPSTPSPSPPPADDTVLLTRILPSLAKSPALVGAYRQALDESLSRWSGLVSAAPPAVAFDLGAAGTQLRQRVDPATTIPARLGELLRSAGGERLGALDRSRRVEDHGIALSPQGDRIMVGPELPAATYQYLAALDQRWMLPGVEELREPHLITLVQTNPQFVQSFLAGLNHEMNRELLWRGYPTDRRGTPFQRFWPWTDGRRDIRPLHVWSAASHLGESVEGGPGGQIVLLLRGELLRRYPNTVVYAWKAARAHGRLGLQDVQGATDAVVKDVIREAVFSGRFDPNFSFVGLRLRQDELTGASAPEGWYFVLQEQPTEPRFGFDEPLATQAAVTAPTRWAEATWAHTGTAPGGHLVIDAPANTLRGRALEGATMARNGAHLARIMLQSPVRYTLHSRHLAVALG